MKTTISKAIVIPNRPMHATTVFTQNIPAAAQQSGLKSTHLRLAPNLLWRLTVRNKGSDETRSSGYDVGGGERKAPANAIDG